jgi:hypothetical protein
MSSPHRHGDYDRARAAEDEHVRLQRAMAARTVAREAHNAQDCSLLLSILGLDQSDPGDGGHTGPSPRHLR